MSLLLVAGLVLGSSLTGLLAARARAKRVERTPSIAEDSLPPDPLRGARFRLGDVLVLNEGSELWLESALLLSDPERRYVVYFAGGADPRRILLVEEGPRGRVLLLHTVAVEMPRPEPPLRFEDGLTLFERRSRLPLHATMLGPFPVPIAERVLFFEYRHEDEVLLFLLSADTPITARGTALLEGSFELLPRTDDGDALSGRREGA